VKYRVLGPLTVSVDGQDQLRLGGRRQRTVLALLLANPNRVLSQDSMVEHVWAGEPPEKGVRTLHTYISNLRRIVGDAIGREGDGYVLRADDDEIDARVFEHLVIEARSLRRGHPAKRRAPIWLLGTLLHGCVTYKSNDLRSLFAA